MKVVVEICERKNVEIEVDDKFLPLEECAKGDMSFPEKLHTEFLKSVEDKVGCPARWEDEEAAKAIENIYTSDMWPIAEY